MGKEERWRDLAKFLPESAPPPPSWPAEPLASISGPPCLFFEILQSEKPEALRPEFP